MLKFKHSPLLILLIGMLNACSNNNLSLDLTPPLIVINNPKNGEKFDAGSFMIFNAIFSDDRALGTFSIDIHNVFDGHGHGRKVEDPDLVKFSFKKNYELPNDKVFIVAMPDEIKVPDNTFAGPYHFIVQAIDIEGNATSYQDASTIEREILIMNESMAQINIINLVNDELEIEANIPFVVEGSISDPPHPALYGIEEVYISLGEPEDEHAHDHGRIAEMLFENFLEGSQLDPYYKQDGSLNLSGMINFTLGDQELSILQSEGVEHLELNVEVHDMQGNITIELVGVHINTN